MKKLNLLLLLFICSLSVFAQNGYLQPLSNLGTIIMPERPIKEHPSNYNDIYTYNADSLIYFAQTLRIKERTISTFVPSMRNVYYGSYIKSCLQGINGSELYNRPVNINGVAGIAFGYKAYVNEKWYYSNQQVVYFDHTLISYAILSTDSLTANDLQVKTFFNSFKFTEAGRSKIAGGIFGGDLGHAIITGLTIAGSIILIIVVILTIRRLAINRKENAQ